MGAGGRRFIALAVAVVLSACGADSGLLVTAGSDVVSRDASFDGVAADGTSDGPDEDALVDVRLPDDSPADAVDEASIDAPTFTTDAGVCIDIEPSDFDRSCQAASECLWIQTGIVCSDGCECGDLYVNQDGQARYDALLNQLPLSSMTCPCPSPPPAECVGGTCMTPEH